MKSITKWGLIFLIGGSLSACSTSQRAQSAEVATEGAAAVAELTGPTEAEILHVIRTVNTSEIEAAQLAKTKSKDRDVIAFANHMIKDHTASNKEVMALAKRWDIDPDGNEISKSIWTGAQATLSSLKNSEGMEFNDGYIIQQVRMHQSLLETIDENLVPNAKNEDIKTFLNKTRTTVEGHLEHARDLHSRNNLSRR